ncbi:MAG: DUF3592 domain-containing protein [Enhygromyxa sp.]
MFILTVIFSVIALVFGGRACAVKQERDLIATGTPASAKVVRVTDTGNRYNHNPEVALTLVVEIEGSEPYQAEVKQVLSPVEIAAYQVGAELEVRYDPQDPQKLAIVGVKQQQGQ